MSNRLTCDSFGNVIFSPESVDGPMHCELQAFQTITPSGQVLAHASRSAPQAANAGSLTQDIFGLSGSGSSASAALQRSMASKLRELTADSGSIWFGQTWKVQATPSRRLIWQLAASAHRIPGSGSILWRTPTATDNKDRGHIGNPSIQRRMRLGKQIGLSMLFRRTPCPFCVGAMMGYPPQWTFCGDTETQSSRS